jgi:hypothetical protein
MTRKYGPLGIRTGDPYRIMPEALVVESLMLQGWVYEMDSETAAQGSRKALEGWTRLGLKFRRTANGERLFDPVEVSNFMKHACLNDRDGFWTERVVPTSRRLVADSAAPGPSGLSTAKDQRFEVDFSRTFNLRSVATGSRLRLRAPLPLSGDHLCDLQVTPFTDSAEEHQIDRGPGRLELRMVAAGQAEVILGAKLSFTARFQESCRGQGAAEPDTSLYLHRREGLIVVSERVEALAQSLAGAGASSLEAVRAFWDYLNRELICGALHYDQIDATSPCDWILDSGWFDCQTGSSLLAALCRARGIPARVVGGYLLYRRAPTIHYWAEVWLKDQGWTPFDLLNWELSPGGRDPKWRDHFFGRVDYRMTTQRLPREFTGALGVPLPEAWFLFQVAKQGGVEVSILDLSGRPVYADLVRVTG